MNIAFFVTPKSRTVRVRCSRSRWTRTSCPSSTIGKAFIGTAQREPLIEYCACLAGLLPEHGPSSPH